MFVFSLTMSNDKDWIATTDIFFTMSRATQAWNNLMLSHKAKLLQVKQVKKALKKDGFLLFTFIDGFGRKWGYKLKKTKVTT